MAASVPESIATPTRAGVRAGASLTPSSTVIARASKCSDPESALAATIGRKDSSTRVSVESAVEEAIGEISVVPAVSADHEANLVMIEGSAPMEDLAGCVADAGYEMSA